MISIRHFALSRNDSVAGCGCLGAVRWDKPKAIDCSVWWGEAPDEPAREDARPTERCKLSHNRLGARRLPRLRSSHLNAPATAVQRHLFATTVDRSSQAI